MLRFYQHYQQPSNHKQKVLLQRLCFLTTSGMRFWAFSGPSEPSPRSLAHPPPPEPRQIPPVPAVTSPRPSVADHRLPGPTATLQLDPPFRSSFSTETARPGYPFPDYPSAPSATTPQSSTFTFEHHKQTDDTRNPFVKPDPLPYNETVKRHLDIYDAEVALNEVSIFVTL